MKKLLLLFLFPSVCFGAGPVTLNQGSGGGTVTINTNPAGSVTPGGSNSNVQYNSSGTALGGDNGFQYDNSVSSITLKGALQSTSNNASIKLDDFGGSGDPTITFNDANGTPGGGLRFQYNGIELSRINTYGGFDIYASTTNNSSLPGIRRLSLPIGSAKAQFFNGSGNAFVEFDPLGNSSFTTSVALATLPSASSLATDSTGKIIAGSGGGGGGLDIVFDAAQSKLPGSNSPFISNSTNEISASVYFDDTSTQTVTWSGLATKYAGGQLYADILFTSTGTTGTINFGVSTATNTPNVSTNNYDLSTYNVEATSSVVTSPNSNSLQKTTVTLSNPSIINGQLFVVQLRRLAGLLDTAAGFARVKKLRIYE